MARSEVKITVTLMSGERHEIGIQPAHTAKDIVGALVQEGKLPGQDSQGNILEYELLDERTMTMLPADRPLADLGVGNGAELRVKPGARVASGR